MALLNVIDADRDPILNIRGNEGLVFDAAEGSLLNVRKGRASITEYSGLVKNVGANEIRYDNGRRVQNNIRANPDYWDVINGSATITPGQPDPDGGNNAYLVEAPLAVSTRIGFLDTQSVLGTIIRPSCWIRIANWDQTAIMTIGAMDDANGQTSTIIRPTGTWARYAAKTHIVGQLSNLTNIYLQTETAFAFVIYHPQSENVTGQSNTNPSEYVDFNTLYNGGLAGVRYFNSLNPNVIDSGERVIERNTVPLSPSMTILSEGVGINSLLWSENFSVTPWEHVNGGTGTPGQAIAPDGFKTGNKVDISDSAATVLQTVSGLNIGTPVNYSLYLRSITGSGTYTFYLNNGLVDIPRQVTLTEDWQRFDISSSVAAGNTVTCGLGHEKYSKTDTLIACYAWGAQLSPCAQLWSYIASISNTALKAADRIRLELVEGVNFSDDRGILLFRWVNGDLGGLKSVFPGLFSIGPRSFSVLYISDRVSSIRTFDGDTAVDGDIVPWAVGDEVIAAVTWNSNTRRFSINISIDLGVTWGEWQTDIYDGSFIASNRISMFLDNESVNNLVSIMLYSDFQDDSIEESQLWIEENAGRITSIDIEQQEER